MLRRLFCFLLVTTLAGCTSSSIQTINKLFIFDGERVFVVDPNKGQATQILGDTSGTHYSVSPDSRWIAYSMVANGMSAIWVKSLNDSSTLRKITDLPFDPDKIVGHIAWSRDAKQLAFLARFTDEPFREQLGIIGIESGKLDFISGPVLEFAWSPVDSKLVAFPSGVDSAIGLYLIDPATDILSRLCKSCYVESLAWSPDGKQVAFIGHQGDQPDQVIILDVAKKTSVLIGPQPSGGYLKEISWSPNGQNIAFCNSANSVLVLNVPSKNVKTVGEHAYRCATWSPDSNFIAYLRDDISNDGKQQVNLVQVSMQDRAVTILTEVTPGVDKIEWR